MRQIKNWRGVSETNKLGINKSVFGKNIQNNIQPKEMEHTFKKLKRIRSAFTTEQINYLEKQFQKFPYINREQRKEVATFLKLDERPIKIWFQNRRMKEKKQNYKECDCETAINNQPQVFGNQLNNVPVSSTNDQLYSLPTLSLTADTIIKSSNNKQLEKNIPAQENHTFNAESKPTPTKLNYYKETLQDKNTEVLSHFFQNNSINTAFSIKTNKNNTPPSQYNSSGEKSIDLYKKYKRESIASPAVVSSTTANEVSNTKKTYSDRTNKNISKIKSQKLLVSKPKPPELQASEQPILNNSAYYPCMPTMYTTPIIPSSVYWKPINIMPIMTTDTPPTINPHGPIIPELKKNCICECHGSTSQAPVTFPSNLQNPYAHYVITVPYQTSM